MKILFNLKQDMLHGSSYGGAESSIVLLGKKLNERGHQSVYYTKGKNVWFLPLVKRRKLYGMPYIFYHAIRGQRFKLVKRFNNFVFNKNVKLNNYDIIYAHYDLNFLELINELKVDDAKPKIIMRMAGMRWYEESKKSKAIRERFEKTFNQIDSVNFISSGLKDLVDKKFDELDMNVNFKHSFIGDIGSSFKPGREVSYQDVQDDTFDIVMATRFSSYQKRQDILVEAAKIVNDKIPFHLTLVGSGPEQAKIKDYICENNLQDKVTVLPFLPQEELWNLMMRSDLLCHSVEYEGLGKIIIESMAMGLPVLTSNVTPMNSYIHDGGNGFLVDNDPKLWAERIIQLYNNYKLRAIVSNNSIEYVREKYDPDKNVSVYEKNFKKLCT